MVTQSDKIRGDWGFRLLKQGIVKVRIPPALAEAIIQLIRDGHYNGVQDFIVAAIRSRLDADLYLKRVRE